MCLTQELHRYDHIVQLSELFSNDVHAIAKVYGIEAACCIIVKVRYIMVCGIEAACCGIPNVLALFGEYNCDVKVKWYFVIPSFHVGAYLGKVGIPNVLTPKGNPI